MRRPLLAAVAALSMIGMSTGAVAQSAAPLSVSAAPLSLAAPMSAHADLQQANDIRGGFILPTLAIIVIGVLIYVLTKNDSPSSP